MKNGLYSIHVTLQDGRVGKGSGVILFRDGKILGGDAYLFYTGSYTVKGDTFKGEVLVQRHTSRAPMPIRCSAARARSASASPAPSPIRAATMNGTALVGKASQIFGATLRKLADDRLAAARARYSAACSSGADARQDDLDPRAAARLGIEIEPAAQPVGHDAVDDVQAEPGAALVAPRREERIERAAAHVEAHAATIVGKDDLDIVLAGLPHLDIDRRPALPSGKACATELRNRLVSTCP